MGWGVGMSIILGISLALTRASGREEIRNVTRASGMEESRIVAWASGMEEIFSV